MPDTQIPIILEALVETLEKMAFVALLPAEPPYQAPVDAHAARIEFVRPQRGCLEVIAPAALGRLLAANQLGVGPDDEAAACGSDDTLRELVNVTCGLMLIRRAEASPEPFHLLIPTVERFDTQRDWATLIGEPGVLVLDADGHIIAVRTSGLD